MTTVMFGPSEKQVAFIKNLLAERDIDEDVAQQHLANLPTMDKATASKLIDALIKLPVVRRSSILQTELSALPKRHSHCQSQVSVSSSRCEARPSLKRG